MKTITLAEIQEKDRANVVYSRELVDRLSELGYIWRYSQVPLNHKSGVLCTLESLPPNGYVRVVCVYKQLDGYRKVVLQDICRLGHDNLYEWKEAGQSTSSTSPPQGTFCNCNSPELVQNIVLGETFNYCRKCKKEKK